MLKVLEKLPNECNIETDKQRKRKHHYKCRGYKYVVIRNGKYEGVFISTAQIVSSFPELKFNRNVYAICEGKTKKYNHFKIKKFPVHI